MWEKFCQPLSRLFYVKHIFTIWNWHWRFFSRFSILRWIQKVPKDKTKNRRRLLLYEYLQIKWIFWNISIWISISNKKWILLGDYEPASQVVVFSQNFRTISLSSYFKTQISNSRQCYIHNFRQIKCLCRSWSEYQLNYWTSITSFNFNKDSIGYSTVD